MAAYMRLCASPTTFTKASEMLLALDVREALQTIRAPTLVTHIDPPGRTPGDLLARPVEASRYVAERIAHARFVELTPGDPPIWAVDQSETLALLREFLTGAWEAGAWEAAEPDRVLATLLFTDIVGSTERAAELGDAGWRDLVQRHHALVRQELVRFRGRELDTAGTASSQASTGRPEQCAAPARSPKPSPNWESTFGLACTRASASSSMERWPASRCTSALVSLPRPHRVKCSCRAPSRILSLGRASRLRSEVSTNSRAYPAPGRFTQLSLLSGSDRLVQPARLEPSGPQDPPSLRTTSSLGPSVLVRPRPP